MRVRARSLLVCAAVLPLVLLSGCGGDSGQGVSATQVVAKVNGGEVTVHQLNQMLSTVRVPSTADRQEQIKQQVVERLIDEELVVQEAEKLKLHRTPEVLSALEQAKRKVVAESYLKQTMQSVTVPSDNEVKKFYDANEFLFANRALFVFSQLTVKADKSRQAELIEEIKGFKSIKEVSDYLAKKEDLELKLAVAAKESEKLPSQLLMPMYKLAKGDVGYIKMSDGLFIVQVHQAIKQSVSFNDAKPVIQQRLMVDKRKEAMEKLVTSLREKAVIEYVGEFKAPE